MKTLGSQYKIAIIGQRDVVSGLRSVGADIFPARDATEALEQMRHLKALSVDDTKPVVYAVVCVIEEVINGVDPVLYDDVVAGSLPAFVIIPGPVGSSGQAEERIRRLAERAVGTALW